ncbi:MAG: hypothetical protein A2234_01735 [Elusimicrobia bacterium RIFOXYA2_FULL_58_8]|nr:MAG: hypothetical protein A2285_08450 [Elusimicrobia bacterium RIFOXYA12_FULL_57_11]OGS12307.1 MAG: hypothetical protein A2234_01735 [Elusimicrobia bacterium RIFOXYA2_FULL_58_8]
MNSGLPLKLLAIFSLLGAAPAAGAQGKSTSTLNAELLPYKISFGAAGLAAVINNYSFTAKNMVFHTLAGEKGELRLELEIIQNISTTTASRYIESRYAVVRDMYNPKAIPYGGAVTRNTECPADMKPDEITLQVLGAPAQILLAYASRRYALGVWDKSTVYKKAAFLIFQDKTNRTLFQVIIFGDLKKLDIGAIEAILSNIHRPPADTSAPVRGE